MMIGEGAAGRTTDETENTTGVTATGGTTGTEIRRDVTGTMTVGTESGRGGGAMGGGSVAAAAAGIEVGVVGGSAGALVTRGMCFGTALPATPATCSKTARLWRHLWMTCATATDPFLLSSWTAFHRAT
jgi:hypothetical protein